MQLATAFRHPPAFMPYFPIGYPTLPVSVDVIGPGGTAGRSEECFVARRRTK